MRVDLHQHLWTPPLLDALAIRDELPFVRRTDGLTILYSAAEPPYVILDESPAGRANQLAQEGVDLAVIAISSPIGIETLPRDDAAELIHSHLDGVATLPGQFAAWGPVPLERPDPDDVDTVLARGCSGLSLPATALSGPDALYAAGPLLDRAVQREVPVFIHPGGAPRDARADVSSSEPLWWRALTDYVAQMQAAWLTFATHGRREHPELTVVFAMLAGNAPLLAERLHARGGPPIEMRHPLTFYDTSSYGPVAIEVLARLVGARQLVYGSDWPLVEPTPTAHDRALLENAARVLIQRVPA
ncbi:MAG TPA: amidohydrolase family protein [Solirubrobacteraceae bacterium]|jgi:predicted TIM-barrel fold metal-dependent hydrolase|nr:amidohydrolase family protein [Solirubrobacteraceae bacterium]